jgi:hypothetical protein
MGDGYRTIPNSIHQILLIFANTRVAMKIGRSILRSPLCKSLLPGLVLVLSAMALSAQPDPLLEHFSVIKNDGRVLLNWVTRPGTTCEGVDVMRSTDSLNYELIYHYAGICGGPNTAMSYSYLDEHPVSNYRNFYRLELGRVGTTGVRAIEVVDLRNQGYQVRPNPIVATSKVYFDNPNREPYQLFLINTTGIVQAQWETREESIDLKATDFQPAMYFLRIQDSDGKVKAQGKVLILR